MRRSHQLSLTAVFAALHAVLYFVSFGMWRNWAIYIAPIEGIILGPNLGFLAALIGSSVARMARPIDFWMFGIIAEPVSVMMAGHLARGRWMPVLLVYAVMLLSYFAHPYGFALPSWTVLDILVALFLIYPAAKLSKSLFREEFGRLAVALVVLSFICVASDSLVRVFLLVPCGLHSLFFPDFEAVSAVFVEGAALSYVEDGVVVLVSLIAGVPLLKGILKLGVLEKSREAE
ncbi:hypothetical protein KEJ15_01430 [Candidatus Bathyarchaeota archaeon]|nr:hypothetical protein [Candidatus Bathyarchaeota archaeon]